MALENNIYLWNAVIGKANKLYSLKRPGQIITSLSSNFDGNILAVGESSGIVKIFDMNKKKVIDFWQDHTSRVGTLSWNGNILTSGGRDKMILNHDIRRPDRSAVTKFIGHKQEICGVKWSFDGNYLASGGNDNKIYNWKLKKQQEVACFSDHSAAVKALAWSPHQKNILASGGGTTDKSIKFWNIGPLELTESIDTGCQVCALQFSKNVNELVSTHGFSINHIGIWKYPECKKIATLNGHS